ncbi:hypothetical protein DFAR_1150015 [Desulfarculales bacterium]
MALEEHTHLTLSRRTSNHSNAHLKELNGIFQITRARIRGYRNAFIFMTMIYIHRRTTGGTHQIPQLTTKNHLLIATVPSGLDHFAQEGCTRL